MNEQSVTREGPDAFGIPIINSDSIRRECFNTPDGRIVGTEYVRHHVWQGRDAGYTWHEEVTDTLVFYSKEEAGAWRAELDHRRHIVLANR